MYALLTKMLISGKMSFKLGEIKLFDEPVGIVPMISLKRMTDDALKRGADGIMELYLQGWVYGFDTSVKMLKILNLKTFEDKYRISMDILSLIGFGDYKTMEYKKGNAVWHIFNNPFSLEYYKSTKCIDHYERGICAGGGTVVQSNIMYCIELECIAQNGKYCKQINLEEKLLKNIDKKLLKEQLPNINYLKKEQIKIIKQCGENPKNYGG